MASSSAKRSIGRGLVFPLLIGTLLVFSYLAIQGPTVQAEPTIDYIQIRTASNGSGEIVGNMTYWVGDTDMYWAAGYNFTERYVKDVEVHWSSRNPAVGQVTERGYNTTFHAVGEGETQVFAYYYNQSNGTNGCYNSTGVITVLYRGIDYVQIRNGSGGHGEVVTTRTYFVDDVDVYYAAAYNATNDYLGDVPVEWSSNDTSVCGVTRAGTSTTLTALGPGVCRVSATYNATIGNETGDLTVKHRTTLTVDDNGPADYSTIHEAVENASDGYIIFVHNGTYDEHVIVNKTLILKGESTGDAIVDGGGTGTVFYVTAKNVNITKFTVRNAEYGIYLDHTNYTRITYCKVTSYDYGIYSNRTRDAFIAWNTITIGKYGIVTDHAKNDAVRWNDISYNTVYGAKDYDSTLKNCFNWNHFHHNKVAYYYDPEEPLDPLLFDGNRIEQNEVGIMAYLASSLIATNNTIVNNDIGVDLTKSSPSLSRNLIRDNRIGVRFSDSSAQISGNHIQGGDYGVYGTGISPTFEDNAILDARVSAVEVRSGDELRLLRNDLDGGTIRLYDSVVRGLTLKRSVVEQVNSTVYSWTIDSASRIEVQWYLTVHVADLEGRPLSDVVVSLKDVSGREVTNASTTSNGIVGPLIVTGRVRLQNRDETVGPYSVEAVSGDLLGRETIVMDGNKELALALGPIPVIGGGGGIPWLFFGLVGFTGVLTIAGLMSIEVVLYFVLALFVPLYTKLRKDQVLDHYSRGRVYQYIELNPGEHFNSIKRALDLNIGTATYHLEVLSRSGLITSRQDGIYKRFYPTNMPIPPSNGGSISEVQLRVLNLIKDSPGVTQKELSRLLGVRQSTLNYQIAKLEEKDLVVVRRTGRKVHYYSKQPPPPRENQA